MRNYTYDKTFMEEVYPLQKKQRMTTKEIYALYNQFWAQEAADNDRYYHHIWSYEAFNQDTWIKLADDGGFGMADDNTNGIEQYDDNDLLDIDDDHWFHGEQEEEEMFFSSARRVDGPLELAEESPLYPIFCALTQQQQTILILLYGDMTQTNIGLRLGVTPQAINKQLRTIRKKLLPYCEENHLLKVKKQAS